MTKYTIGRMALYAAIKRKFPELDHKVALKQATRFVRGKINHPDIGMAEVFATVDELLDEGHEIQLCSFPRFLLFYGDVFYPNGGAADFKEFGESIEELRTVVDNMGDRNPDFFWHEIVDAATMEPV